MWVSSLKARVRVTLLLTVCLSVRLGVEPTLGLTTRCYFPLEVWCLKLSVSSLFGRPLWLEVGSVICQSKSVVVCQGKIHIYIFVLYTYQTCTYNIYRASFSPGSVQQIMPYYLQVAHATTEVQILERSYKCPPPSLSLLYFLCRASPCPIFQVALPSVILLLFWGLYFEKSVGEAYVNRERRRDLYIINATLISMVEDLFRIGNGCLSL
jgi:hypothetical protein